MLSSAYGPENPDMSVLPVSRVETKVSAKALGEASASRHKTTAETTSVPRSPIIGSNLSRKGREELGRLVRKHSRGHSLRPKTC